MTKAFRASVKTNADQLDAIGLGFEQENVVYESTALAISPNSGMILDYAAASAGQVQVRGTLLTAAISASTVTIAAADGTNPRIDVVTVDTGGTVAKTDGTAAADPAPPSISATEMALAYVYVAAGVSTINSADITDARIYVPHYEEWVPVDIPPWDATATTAGAGNTAYLMALRPLTRSVIATQIVVNLGGSTDNLDVGLYTFDGTDMTRVVSMGSTAFPGTGTQAFNISDTQLNPGNRYFVALAADGTTATWTKTADTAPGAVGNGLAWSLATSFPLPATISSPSAAATGPVAYVTVTGGSVT